MSHTVKVILNSPSFHKSLFTRRVPQQLHLHHHGTDMLITSLSHPCSGFGTQREKGLYFMSVESGEEVDKEVDSYNQHKYPY